MKKGIVISLSLMAILTVWGLSFVSTVQAAEKTVCSSGCDYNTIAAAIADSTADPITIKTGTYTELGLTINRNVTINGAGASTTIVQAHSNPNVAADRVFSINSGKTVTISDVTIQNGKIATGSDSTNDGGGIFNKGTLTITNCIIKGNKATDSNGNGGGIRNEFNSTLKVTNCVFDGNEADYGGGINSNNGNLEVTNSIFISNNATSAGGGINNSSSSSTPSNIVNCTFNANSASNNNGGGLYSSSGTVNIFNSIFWGNKIGNTVDREVKKGGGVLTVNYSCVEIGYGSGTGNISTDPKFVNATNLHIQAGSPAIDAGDNGAPNISSTDLDGNARKYDVSTVSDTGIPSGGAPFVDMGAYEVQPDINVKEGATNISTGGTSSFAGDVELGTSSAEKTFTIENLGQGDLHLSSVTLGGTDSSYFTFTDLTASYPATLGASTNFKLKFTPPLPPTGTAGSKSATITISSDDPNEPTYTITVTGTAKAVPRIVVKNPSGNAIGTTGYTYSFLKTKIPNSSSAAEFTIDNTAGTGELTVTVSSNNAQFIVSDDPTSVAIGASGTFKVTFKPSSLGNQTATITITHNDGTGKAAYNITVKGEGTDKAPDINLKDPGDVNLADGTGIYTFINTPVNGSSGTKTFKIENTGNDDLNLTGVPSLSGTNPDQFHVSGSPSSPISQSGSTSFMVEFKPTSNGLKKAVVTIVNDDSDENPYTFEIKGEGVDTFPEMYVKQGSTSIPKLPNPGYGFGNVGINITAPPVTFTIENSGTANLHLTGSPKVAKSGGNPDDFFISQDFIASSVASGGGTTTFTIAFKPSAGGGRSTTISIANDDSDDNPYTFKVEGTGVTAPEINLKQSSTNIPSGGSYDFGNINQGGSSGAVGFTVENIGNENLFLTGSKVSISGSSDFSLNDTTISPVASATSTSFSVTFAPTGVGGRSATVSITSNDADEGTYSFTVSGTGMTSQSITFPVIPNKVFGNPAFGISASASSGLPVSFTSLTPSVVTVSGSAVYIVGAGTAVIQASQGGGGGYYPAGAVNQSFSVSRADQSISFAPLANRTFGDNPFTIGASASSGLTVSFSSSNPSVATVSGTTVTITGSGSSTITASQGGNGNYNAAPNVTQTLTVAGKPQSIGTVTFTPALPSVANVGDSFTVSASSSSGLPVSFTTSNPAVAAVSGNTVIIAGPGSASICAVQSGNSNYSPAPNICYPVSVNSPPVIAEGTSVTVTMDEGGSPRAFSLTLNATDADNDTLTWEISSPASYGTAGASGTGSAKMISYRPSDSHWNGSDLFEVKVSDGRGGTAKIMVNVRIMAVNDAPVLDTSYEPKMNDIDEDAVNTIGTSVAQIIPDGSVSDADGVAVKAIAVTEADNTNGVWQYSANGSTWKDFSDIRGSIAAIKDQARLLSDTYSIRFVPNPDYNGLATFTFRAWDKSEGMAGGSADTRINGGSTAFSSAEDHVSITVKPVDDPPRVENPIQDITVVEDSPPTQISLADVFTDPDNEVSLISKEVGTVVFETTQPILEAKITGISGNTLMLTYLPNQNGAATVTIIAKSGGLSVSHEFSVTVVNQLDAAVLPVLDPYQFPALTPINEDDFNSKGNTLDEILPPGFITHPDGLNVRSVAVTGVNNLRGKWQYSLNNGSTWQDFSPQTGTVVIMNDNARLLTSDHRVRFIPKADYYGTSRFTFKAWDMTDGSAPGSTAAARNNTDTVKAFSLGTAEAVITVKPVDDPPVVISPIDDQVVYRGETSRSILLSSVFSDIDTDPASITKQVIENTDRTLVETTVQDNLLTLTFKGKYGSAVISVLALSNGKMVRDSFVVTVKDEDKPSSGTVITDPDGNPIITHFPQLSGIDEDDVNNPGNTVAEIFEGNILSDVSFFKDSGGDSITAIAVIGVNNRIGIWQYSLDDGMTWKDFSPVRDNFVYIDKAARLLNSEDRIRFVPKANYYGKSSVTFRAWDEQGIDGGTLDISSLGGKSSPNISLSKDDAEIEIAPIDDPPSVLNPIADILLTQGDAISDRQISLSKVFTDVDDDPSLITVSLADNTNPGFVKASISKGILYVKVLQGDAYGEAVITVRATSNGKTGDDSFTVSVSAPNSAPILDTKPSPKLTSVKQNPEENPGNSIAEIVADGSISDMDSEGESLKAIAVIGVDNTHGIWQYSLDSGMTWNDFSPIRGQFVTIENEALLLDGSLTGDETQRIRFTPNADYSGSANFAFRAWDMTVGVAGETSDAGVNGGQTAFSSTEDQASVLIIAEPDDDPDPDDDNKCKGSDVDGNGTVDLGDAILVLKVLTGLADADYINLEADVNGDGKIGMAELFCILNYLVIVI